MVNIQAEYFGLTAKHILLVNSCHLVELFGGSLKLYVKLNADANSELFILICQFNLYSAPDSNFVFFKIILQ